jgi:hypothetical protein
VNSGVQHDRYEVRQVETIRVILEGSMKKTGDDFGDSDPGGHRRMGSYWYRYFMGPEDWWVGINANLASAGVGLIRAGKIIQDPELYSLAQRQLDWIIGSNPYNASTVVGVGYNHPQRFVNSIEFEPETQVLPGTVMNGIGGTYADMPDLYDASYHTAEYWTPMVAYTLWLLSELKGVY